ncbi:membrane-spanning 4-domains subfamily A member 4D-like [Gastrophryne carolinensis]
MPSSADDANLPSYEALPNEVPAEAPAAYSTPAQFNVHMAPLGYNVPPAPQMWKVPTVAPQWSVAAVVPQITEASAFYQTFLRAKPKALGIVIILAAVIQIALGIGLIFTTFSISLPSGIPFWGPIFYIIAGSLTVAAKVKPNVCLVKGSLALNIVTSIFTFIGLILTCVDFTIIWCFNHQFCYRRIVGGYVIHSILLVTNLLLFCTSVAVSVFGCRSLGDVSSIVPQVFVIQNDVVISMPPSVYEATAPAFPQQSASAPPPPYIVQEDKTRPAD